MSQVEESQVPGLHLNGLLHEAGLDSLDAGLTARFEAYLALLLRWNARANLTAIRSAEEILSRHFVESIFCARRLPAGVATLLDFGSGAGFPGIPIALCRPEVEVTLAESQGKKAAFLQEAVRTLGIPAKVYAKRAETLGIQFDCVILRAVDRMPSAVESASGMVAPDGHLALMTTLPELEALQIATGDGFSWSSSIPLPNSDERVLAIGTRTKEATEA